MSVSLLVVGADVRNHCYRYPEGSCKYWNGPNCSVPCLPICVSESELIQNGTQSLLVCGCVSGRATQPSAPLASRNRPVPRSSSRRALMASDIQLILEFFSIIRQVVFSRQLHVGIEVLTFLLCLYCTTSWQQRQGRACLLYASRRTSM